MKAANVLDGVRHVLVERFDLGLRPGRIAPAEPLFDGGLEIDSMSAIELVVALEETFGVVLEEADLTERNFATVGDVARLVERKLAKEAAG